MAETLQEAVAGIPEASWTSSDGTQLSSREILSQWPQDKLQEPVDFGEDRFGMTTIRSRAGETILTMLGPTGPDIPSEPPVAPAE